MTEIQFTPEEQAWIDNNPVVYHGYDPQWKPVGFVDDNGKYSGITSGYLDLIGPRLGIDFKPYPGIEKWSDAIHLLKEGKLVLLPALAQNEERDTYLDFTDIYISHAFVIVSQKESDFIGGLDFLEGKKVATPEDYYITGLLQQEEIGMDLIYKSGTENCLLAVSTGEADVTIANVAVVSHYLNYSGFENLKIASPTHYPDMDVKMGVAKGNKELISILQKGLLTITQKEESEIVQKWVSVQYEHGVNMKKIWIIGSISIGIALLILGTFIFYHRKMKKEIVLRIEAQDALNKTFDEINDQKAIIEHKNDEVMSSITYAERLQNAVLPTLAQIQNAFPSSFVLFLPKDIVSGDFYFLETKEKGNKIFFATADCTGHGVPGAMVSLLCSNALHDSISSKELDKPSDVLNWARENLEKRFERSGAHIKDGMDIAFCSLNKATKQLMYAGAFNPLWIVRNNDYWPETEAFEKGCESKLQILKEDHYHLIEIVADRQPLGKFEYAKAFTNHNIQLIEGDTIYLSSDGYADQFGGDKGKKMKSKNFKKLLLSIQDQSMGTQADNLESQFFKWKNEFEQIDDVCVMGVKV